MDVREAQAFLAVAEELHFGRAAQRLHMAQPPLSRLIRQIEAGLGAPLFERNTRQVLLTPAGAALIEPARELVMLSQQMKETVRRAQAGETGRVRFGFAGASVNRFVGELARRVRVERPHVHLDLRSSEFSHRGLEKVIDGSLDMLIGRWDFLPAEVESRVIADEDLLIALPDHHRLASGDTVSAKSLANEPWIVLPGAAGATLPNRFNRLAIAGGFVPRVVQVAPDSPTMLVLVGAGIGVSITFSGVEENVMSSGVVFKRIEPDQGRVELRLIWRRGDPNPALPAVVDISRRVFPHPTGGRRTHDVPPSAEPSP